MKITKRYLRRIIKEEKAKLLNEAPTSGDLINDIADIIRSLGDIVEVTSNGNMETPDMGGLDLELQEEVADFVGDAIVNLNRALSTLAVPPPIREQHTYAPELKRDEWNPGAPPVEITDSVVTQAQISDAWPNVIYNGKDVMDLMYDDMVVLRAEDALEDISGENFEGQEAYLGWDPNEDVFVMGFDVWLDHGMEAGIVTLSPQGRVIDVNMGGSGMYPSGRAMIRKTHPEILELRLD